MKTIKQFICLSILLLGVCLSSCYVKVDDYHPRPEHHYWHHHHHHEAEYEIEVHPKP